jgi:chromosome segregation protein
MLRLQKMKISGFKSFSDSTEVLFPSGITAVVGPNGCGKSNIGDAINWVLGEQSAKMLRGTSMQDVIFNGSEARKPQGMAEVSLELSGLNGSAPGETRQVVLTRRLFRSGDSEYLLNGGRTRLKDIQDILREARVGAKTYATIEQGKIDQILNAKPKERRLLIEEAAGVAGFKHKRRLAELKLEATHANLLRVNDIVVEVQRQINSLKRQAAAARRYQRLRDELRSKERVRFTLLARRLDRELAGRIEAEAIARDAEAGAAARLAGVEAELLGERTSLDEADRAARESSERLHQLEIEVDREEARIRLCRERIQEAEAIASRMEAEAAGLGERLEAARGERARQAEIVDAGRAEIESAAGEFGERQSELDAASREVTERRQAVEALRRGLFETLERAADCRNTRRAVEEALDRTAAQRTRLEAERAAARTEGERLQLEAGELEERLAASQTHLDALQAALASTEKAFAEARSRLEAGTRELSAAREEEKSAAARLATLEDLQTRFAGVSDGVRTLLAQGPAAGVRATGVVADFVEAAREIESAAEVYLQAVLPAVIVEDETDALAAASLLRREGAGRTHFICRSQPAGRPAVGNASNGSPAFSDEVLSDPRIRGRLRDGLSLKSSANGVVQDRIGDAVLVESLEAALDIHRRYPDADYLTPQGDVVYASGVVAVGGRQSAEKGLLAHNRGIQEAKATLGAAAERAARLHEQVGALRDEVSRSEGELASRREELERTRGERAALDLIAQRSLDERDRTGRRARVLEDELEALEAERVRLAGDQEQAVRLLEEAETSHAAAESRLREEVASLEAKERDLRAASERVAELRARVAALRQRQEAAERDATRLAEAEAELLARIETAQSEAEEARRRRSESAETQIRTETGLAEHLRERERLASEVADRERRIAERRQALAGREGLLKDLKADLESLREAARARELERAGVEADRRHLDELCRQELGMSATEAAADPEGGSDAGEPETDPAALEGEIAETKAKIERIGPVNMMAIEEFASLEDRYRFLITQKQDLEQSMESLRETIRKLNRQSRERFQEAFEAIRANYQEVFKLLFNGGRADLRLEEGEDLLEAGVEILAQPPGKRLGSVSLLSGGEKAMAAVALLFAIFRYQPSPFCLLDEVDAALDDVNVNRFTRMLREYAAQTQFILVTHNKRSMEAADLLYGVTMEEPGVSKVVSLQLE